MKSFVVCLLVVLCTASALAQSPNVDSLLQRLDTATMRVYVKDPTGVFTGKIANFDSVWIVVTSSGGIQTIIPRSRIEKITPVRAVIPQQRPVRTQGEDEDSYLWHNPITSYTAPVILGGAALTSGVPTSASTVQNAVSQASDYRSSIDLCATIGVMFARPIWDFLPSHGFVFIMPAFETREASVRNNASGWAHDLSTEYLSVTPGVGWGNAYSAINLGVTLGVPLELNTTTFQGSDVGVASFSHASLVNLLIEPRVLIALPLYVKLNPYQERELLFLIGAGYPLEPLLKSGSVNFTLPSGQSVANTDVENVGPLRLIDIQIGLSYVFNFHGAPRMEL